MYGSYFLGNEGGSWMLFLFIAILFASYSQMKVSGAYNKYSKISSGTGYTGAQIARILLDRNGLDHVTIEMVHGKLSDHYDPRTKVLRLSNSIHNGSSVASMSVAAHEVGHAIQHDIGYFMLVLRNNIAPMVNISSKLVWVFIFLGIMISPILADIGIAMFLFIVFFQLITLPVELDASKRALAELSDGISPTENIRPAKKMLNAAALTYVASTLVAIAQLLRLLAMTNRRRN